MQYNEDFSVDIYLVYVHAHVLLYHCMFVCYHCHAVKSAAPNNYYTMQECAAWLALQDHKPL